MGLSAEAIEVLQAGRRKVLAGWCQGKLQDVETGAVCAYGGLHYGWKGRDITFDLASLTDALFALEDELGLTHAPASGTVAIEGWNDAPERTLADVVGLFDRVLAKAAARELAVASA